MHALADRPTSVALPLGALANGARETFATVAPIVWLLASEMKTPLAWRPWAATCAASAASATRRSICAPGSRPTRPCHSADLTHGTNKGPGPPPSDQIAEKIPYFYGIFPLAYPLCSLLSPCCLTMIGNEG